MEKELSDMLGDLLDMLTEKLKWTSREEVSRQVPRLVVGRRRWKWKRKQERHSIAAQEQLCKCALRGSGSWFALSVRHIMSSVHRSAGDPGGRSPSSDCIFHESLAERQNTLSRCLSARRRNGGCPSACCGCLSCCGWLILGPGVASLDDLLAD